MLKFLLLSLDQYSLDYTCNRFVPQFLSADNVCSDSLLPATALPFILLSADTHSASAQPRYLPAPAYMRRQHLSTLLSPSLARQPALMNCESPPVMGPRMLIFRFTKSPPLITYALDLKSGENLFNLPFISTDWPSVLE